MNARALVQGTTVALVLAGFGVLLVFGDQESIRRFAFVDFYDYYFAADAVSTGDDPYDAALGEARAAAAGAPTIAGSDFIYPPWFAAALVPLTGLSPQGAASCWYLASAVALLLALSGLPTGRTRRGELVAAVLFPGTLVALFVGQVNPILLALIVGAWRWRDDRPATSGLLLGLAAAIKLSPILLLVACACWRRWRLVAASIVVMSTCLVVGELAVPGGTATYATGVLPNSGALTPALAHPGNQGIGGALLRAMSPNPWTIPFVEAPSTVTPMACVLGALVFGAIIWTFAHRARQQTGDELWCWAAVITAMVIASPRAWEASYVLLLFPIAVVRNAHPRVAALCWLLAASQRALDDFAQAPSRYGWLQVVSPLVSLALCGGVILLVTLLRSHER